MRATLETALRVRRLAVEQARRDLAARLATEAEAANADRAAREAIHREACAATATDAPDAHVEVFASWLPRARQHAARARELRLEAEAASNVARAALAAAQSAQEAVEAVLADHARARQVQVARGDQIVLDEVAQRSWRRNP